MKLPGATSGQTAERPELTFTGPATKVPVAALDLVRAYARGRALSPVATVHTARDPVEIRAPDGTVLAEVVDDAVTARVGSRLSRRFREIEVEAKGDGPTGGEVLTAALERIVRATGREETEQPVSKVVRALGARAMRPADVVVPELGGQGSLVMPHSRLLPAHDTAKGPRFGQCSGPKVPPRRSRWTVVASPQRS